MKRRKWRTDKNFAMCAGRRLAIDGSSRTNSPNTQSTHICATLEGNVVKLKTQKCLCCLKIESCVLWIDLCCVSATATQHHFHVIFTTGCLGRVSVFIFKCCHTLQFRNGHPHTTRSRLTESDICAESCSGIRHHIKWAFLENVSPASHSHRANMSWKWNFRWGNASETGFRFMSCWLRLLRGREKCPFSLSCAASPVSIEEHETVDRLTNFNGSFDKTNRQFCHRN